MQTLIIQTGTCLGCWDLHFYTANRSVITWLLIMRSHWSLSFYAFSKIFHTFLTFFMADVMHQILRFRKFVNLVVRVADCSFSSAP